MSTNSFAHRRRSLPGVVVCDVLTAACGSAPVPTSPLPIPESTQYRVSGIVMGAADAAPIASATVEFRHRGRVVNRPARALATMTWETTIVPRWSSTLPPAQFTRGSTTFTAIGPVGPIDGRFFGPQAREVAIRWKYPKLGPSYILLNYGLRRSVRSQSQRRLPRLCIEGGSQ